MKALIFAHWDAGGKIQSDHIRLLREVSKMGFKVVLVSTNLSEDAASHLPSEIEIIIRPNYGYDFLSFAIGIDLIEAECTNQEKFDRVILINSSILIIDQEIFIDTVLKYHSDTDFTGLSYSYERNPHLQTYFLSFSPAKIKFAFISGFLKRAAKLKAKEDFINEIEIKLTHYLCTHGHHFDIIFCPSSSDKTLANMRLISREFCPSEEIIKLSINHDINIPSNPCHFLWDRILTKHGFVKRELVEKNPAQLNLNPLRLLLESNGWTHESFRQYFNLRRCVIWTLG